MNIVHEAERHRFVAFDAAGGDGEASGEMMGEIQYSPHVSPQGGVLSATHTIVREEHQGKGVARALLGALVAYARAEGVKILPVCSYAVAEFRKRPEEYADVVAESRAKKH